MTGSNQLDVQLDGDVREWVGVLPKYQRDHIEGLLERSTPLEAATAWLDSTGPKDTAPYGGIRMGSSNFYANLLVEMKELFCGGARYEGERKQAAEAFGAGKVFFVSAVSALLATHIGVVATIIAPVVAITLGLLAKAGSASICSTLSMMIDERKSVGDQEIDM